MLRSTYIACLVNWLKCFVYSFGVNFRISGVRAHRMLNNSPDEHIGRRDTGTHQTRCPPTVTMYVSCTRVQTAHPHACGCRGARRLNPTYLQFEYKTKTTFNDTVPTVYEASNKRYERNEREFWNTGESCKLMYHLLDFRLLPWSRWELRSSGLLRSVWWQFLTDVSGRPFDSIVKGKELKKILDPSRWDRKVVPKSQQGITTTTRCVIAQKRAVFLTAPLVRGSRKYHDTGHWKWVTSALCQLTPWD